MPHRPAASTRPRPASPATQLALLLATLPACLALLGPVAPLRAQDQPPAPPPAAVALPAAGEPVLDVRITGNRQISDREILNVLRTRPGSPFEPAVVQDDYQRIFRLGRFSRVEARYAPTPEGVVVIFDVAEQDAVQRIVFRGNTAFEDDTLRQLINLEVGRGLNEFGVALARNAIERLYLSRNYALSEIRTEVDQETGQVTFLISEGPKVFVRNIDFVGAHSFTEPNLKGQIGSRIRLIGGILGFNGRYDPQQVEDDVSALVRYYKNEGFFDVRVGRRIVFSPDQTAVEVQFLIEEGLVYRIDRIRFVGNERLNEADLRAATRVQEGAIYKQADVERDKQRMVDAYSPFGLIHVTDPFLRDPDYLTIREDQVFFREPGSLELVYRISEGRPFNVGQIDVRGNVKTQDKVILRNFDLAPGELYDSTAVRRGVQRMRGSNYFGRIDVSPVGTEEESRDLLIEVDERSTASFLVGGSVNSNGGLQANIEYRQNNFDLFDWPRDLDDFFSGNALAGAGQTFVASFQPGTVRTNASLSFFEPYLFDQPVGFGAEAYYRQFRRRQYDDRRAGGRVRFSRRWERIYSTEISFRGEDVRISGINDPRADRAQEIIDAEGHTTLTSIGFGVGRDTIDNPFLPRRGTRVQLGWESFGLLGGEPNFQKVSAGFNFYQPIYEDLLDRPTVFEIRLDGGAIYNNAPFYERYYAGGFGSVRGFRFRGISPRGGNANDAIGGDFVVTGSAAVGFPLVGESLRGVVFGDFGDVQPDLELGTVRVSAGAGIRLFFAAFGNLPLAIDFAWPLNADELDDEQIVSFSLGLIQ